MGLRVKGLRLRLQGTRTLGPAQVPNVARAPWTQTARAPWKWRPFGEYSILFSGLVPEAHRSIQGVGIALNADLLKA